MVATACKEKYKFEKWQKEAFESLLLQKDSKHQRISSQIELIERELMQMTLVEMERRDVRIDSEKNMLTEKRQELSKMLVQLIEEKEHREEQIKNRLLEMEQAKLDNQMDYWLVQYQRLMDRKPDALINQEIQLEYAVENILREANASDYIPLFARHRISIETMEILTEEDMCKMGVTELGIRKAIIKAIQEYQDEQQRAAKKTKDIEKTKDAEPSESQEADAAIAPPSAGVTPSAPPVTELIARVTSDCVVCMDSRSEMIFMNCGHVCCCKTCSESLPDCPLCRQKIVQKIRLTQG
ncbi:E3 ubiquitin-protein ligase LRSAM1-like [Lingula anatina]|uniref:E3 ubiquitin-protein ligase LRSAM1-like n=1 Tax=Lingula anatina TaxID=7574 RepID=A0A1S3JZ99_LINAN|nr:E3 ubiquitin-protein ligase LRSAM1-like [Lingula anatina]|eukprot:XP_013415725.1 E3 ubiquitin-protein ligase LRSAM1-like [Lingula anatina]